MELVTLLRGPRKVPHLFHHVRLQWETEVYEKSASAMISALLVFRIMRNEFIIYKLPGPWYLVIAAWMDFDTSYN